MLLSEWHLPEVAGTALVAYNIAEGQDWIRTLGILQAGGLRLQRDYLTPELDDQE